MRDNNMKYSSMKKSKDSRESINSERKINENNLSFRKIDISSNLSMKIDRLERELNRLNEKRIGIENFNFKYYSQKKDSLKIIDFDIRLIKERIEPLIEKLENPIIRISSINSKKFRNIGNGIYIQRK
jgi:hypothetical protein